MAEQEQKQVQLLKTKANKKAVFKPRQRLSNEPLTEDEVRKLLESVTEPRDYALLLLGFNSGMRVSEAVTLDYGLINAPEGTVTIFDAKKDKHRKVYLPVATISALQRYYATLPKKTNRVFDFGTKTAENIIQRWTAKTLGKKKSWHAVRHTYVTLSVLKGTKPAVVCANTGDSAATILHYYTNLPPQAIRQDVEDNAVYKEH